MYFCSMETIKKYFPLLTENQIQQLEQLQGIYADWNSKINVISRKDMDRFMEHHVLHSMTIARYYEFKPGQKVLDVGTGGGFPGIPLSIMFPETQFTLVDSIAKKIKVVQAVAEALHLNNVEAVQARVEEMKGVWDVVVSRAVASLPEFMQLIRKRLPITKTGQPMVLYLKGGNLDEELEKAGIPNMVHDLSHTFSGEYFQTKKLVKVF